MLNGGFDEFCGAKVKREGVDEILPSIGVKGLRDR